MRVREFMTTNVITISSDAPVATANDYMKTHKVRRLPVVDKGKLVGIVGDRKVAETSPSAATSLSVWEINALMSKVTVKDVMRRDVLTVSPNTTAESALALAQEYGVGALPIVDEKERLVGIVTTNDFVYRIMNPMLGIGKPGARLHIYDCGAPRKMEEVLRVINRHELEIEAIHVDDSYERDTRDLIVQVNTKDPSKLVQDLTDLGYMVAIRERKSWPIGKTNE